MVVGQELAVGSEDDPVPCDRCTAGAFDGQLHQPWIDGRGDLGRVHRKSSGVPGRGRRARRGSGCPVGGRHGTLARGLLGAGRPILDDKHDGKDKTDDDQHHQGRHDRTGQVVVAGGPAGRPLPLLNRRVHGRDLRPRSPL